MTKRAEVHEIESPAEGVKALERTFTSKANSNKVTQRLYSRADGFAIGAVRGGPLHMADETTWEVFTMNDGIMIGEPVGWVADETLERTVRALATWGQEAA